MSDIRNFDLRQLQDAGDLEEQDLVLIQRPWLSENQNNPTVKRIYGAKVMRTTKDEWSNTVSVEDGYWEDLRFPAQSINPAGSASPASVDSTTYPGTLLFAGNADNHVAGVAQLPHSWHRGTPLRPHIHWAKTTTATGEIAWRFRYAWEDIGGTFTTYSSWQAPATGGVSHDDTANKHALTNFPEMAPATGVGESSIVLWELMRDVSEDAVADAVRLFEIDFHYQTNKSGTRREIPET
jgi:hypothetical protein